MEYTICEIMSSQTRCRLTIESMWCVYQYYLPWPISRGDGILLPPLGYTLEKQRPACESGSVARGDKTLCNIFLGAYVSVRWTGATGQWNC